MAPVSPTQRVLSPDDVVDFVRSSFGPDRRVADCGPLSGGGFAAVWWVRLDDGRPAGRTPSGHRDVVLKVAPPPTTRLLRYETDLLAAEARYFRLVAARAPQVPVPPVLHHGRDRRLGEWLVTGRLPGLALPDLDGHDGPVRADLGAATAALHRITGDRFGYDAGRTGGPTWSAAFTAMIEDLLADAADWQVALPVPPQRLRALVARHGELLDTVRRPTAARTAQAAHRRTDGAAGSDQPAQASRPD